MAQIIAEVQFIGPADADGQAACSAWRSQPQCPICMHGVSRPANKYAIQTTCEHCGTVLTIRVLKVDCDEELIRVKAGANNPAVIVKGEPHGEAEQG